jgi:hypothetical protein
MVCLFPFGPQCNQVRYTHFPFIKERDECPAGKKKSEISDSNVFAALLVGEQLGTTPHQLLCLPVIVVPVGGALAIRTTILPLISYLTKKENSFIVYI